MKWGDIQLKEDADGEYLQYSERHETRNGEESHGCRAYAPKAFEDILTDRTHCPVTACKEFARQRPAKKKEDSHFYLAVNITRNSDSNRYVFTSEKECCWEVSEISM